ncbi:putative carboxylesterase 12 [Acorus calamus]|uniref:Carboxylesterase 12 n=1 Tax=Acorus calamus TaxID=4465 RepID=A0AAV9F7I6_ACOCL|nr:putative carboxylesterase 12 [Acorus calamus]
MAARNQAAAADDIVEDFSPFFWVYKDGRVGILRPDESVPPSTDPRTGVCSKDVLVLPKSDVSARLYLPNLLTSAHQRLPLLITFHGRGFCLGSRISLVPSAEFHQHRLPHFSPSKVIRRALNALVAEAGIVALSVGYLIQWAVSHSRGGGPEAWLMDHVDFGRVFLSGDSAGANIAYNMAMRAGKLRLAHDVRLRGLILNHPYLWGSDVTNSEAKNPELKSVIDRIWLFGNPNATGLDDPMINPVAAGGPSLSRIGCEKVLVCVAEMDILGDRGWIYYEALLKSGWGGKVEFFESEGEEHCFYVGNIESENSKILLKKLASFMGC